MMFFKDFWFWLDSDTKKFQELRAESYRKSQHRLKMLKKSWVKQSIKK